MPLTTSNVLTQPQPYSPYVSNTIGGNPLYGGPLIKPPANPINLGNNVTIGSNGSVTSPQVNKKATQNTPSQQPTYSKKTPTSNSGLYGNYINNFQNNPQNNTGNTGNTYGRTGTPAELAAAGYIGTSYPGLINSLVTSSTQGNQNIANQAENIANQAGQQITDIGRQGANAQSGYLTTGTTPVAEGNSAIQAQNTAAQQQAVAQGAEAQLAGLNTALTAQGQTQTGLTSAGNLAAPVIQFGQLTNPQTGAVVGAGVTGNNPMLENAVAQTVRLIQNGATQQDAINTTGLANFGAAGSTLLTQALQGNTGGGYNPSAQNAIASENIALGQTTQGQAFDLDTALKQLDAVSNVADSFGQNIQELNPTDNKILNKSINSYIGNVQNPTAVTEYYSMMADIDKYRSQILAANNGQIPTAITNELQSGDPSNLSVNQIKYVLNFMKTLGANQLAVTQGQTNAAYGGGSITTPYAGTPTNTNSNVPTPPDASANVTPSQTLQATEGTLFNIGQGIASFLSNPSSLLEGVGLSGIAGKLFGSI